MKPPNVPSIVSALEISFLCMVPIRFNSRFTVAAGNGTVGRKRLTTSDELNTAVSLNDGTSSPVCTFDLALVE